MPKAQPTRRLTTDPYASWAFSSPQTLFLRLWYNPNRQCLDSEPPWRNWQGDSESFIVNSLVTASLFSAL